MFSELQEAGKLVTPEDERRAVSIVAREARRMSHLLDNILSFSSLQRNGEYAMPRDRIRLGDAVSEGVKAVGALAHDGAMELRVAIEPDLHVFANREAVTRIVVNLLDNAIKYGPVGQTVQVEVTRANGSARLAVTDEGPGIPEAERNRIWDPYRRLERDVKGQIPGSGIGLSVVSQLASLQGGHASVAEGPGGGARFIVELPIADEASELARASPSGLER
jgi:signal transduction histidine kinase